MTVKIRTFAAFIIAGLCSKTQALMQEARLPVHTSSLTLDDLSHSEHTTGEHGNFVHPFHQVAPEVQTIFYPKSNTISKKLHRVQGPSRHQD